MKFLAHRGLWRHKHEQNTLKSFQEAIAEGFGIETDVRDFGSTLRIAHDVPSGNEPHFEEFIDLLKNADNCANLPMAINIKADGLAQQLKALMPVPAVADSFFFDMSVPDQRSYLKLSMPVYARMSEVEKTPAWLDASQGVWLDQFEHLWFKREQIAELLAKGKKICIVSSELHGRDPEQLWEMLIPYADDPNVMLCTDYPANAKASICEPHR
jgi:hypothetical protein